MPSTLYAILPEVVAPDASPTYPFAVSVGALQDGTTVWHGQEGDAIPNGAIVYEDGTAPWTWVAFAAEYPKLAPLCSPHEYAGEPNAIGVEAVPCWAPPPPTDTPIMP